MYYPKSQLKPNLFTNGGEYILSTTQEEYKGYYYKISTGKYFTGKNPSQPLNSEIIPIQSTSNIYHPPFIIPSSLLEITLEPDLTYRPTSPYQSRSIPQFNTIPPTPTEKQNGQFTRYFCKRNNELKYIEIDLDTYTLLSTQSPQIAGDLYTPSTLTWQIQGDKNTVYASNQSSVYLVEKTQTWHGFSQYFKGNFLKYYVA
jgi:hypothetical protein